MLILAGIVNFLSSRRYSAVVLIKYKNNTIIIIIVIIFYLISIIKLYLSPRISPFSDSPPHPTRVWNEKVAV